MSSSIITLGCSLKKCIDVDEIPSSSSDASILPERALFSSIHRVLVESIFSISMSAAKSLGCQSSSMSSTT
eukprot:9393847-Ditylum_brightwellii.AAC.1